MKSIRPLLYAGLLICLLFSLGGCDPNSSDATDDENGELLDSSGMTDAMNPDLEETVCGSDQKVPTEIARSWIEEGWQSKYESIGLGSPSENEVVKFGGFDAGDFNSLLIQCDDCPFLSVSFALSDENQQVPHAILMNVDEGCVLMTEGETAALVSSVNRNGGHEISGFTSYETAQEYINYWQNTFEFPDSFETVYSYTYNRDSILDVLNACSQLGSDCSSMLRATYAIHPDTLNGNDHPDSLLMDIIFTCDCEENDSLFFPGEFVDIANPCPPICPNQ